MKEKIQKIISARGLASRRHAEQMILDGRVTCNGVVCLLGERADPNVDDICLDGKALPESAGFVYLALNKPRGYVTTLSDEKGRKNVAQLVASCGKRVYPIGRLDMDSEGLLLFTNDGDFANKLMHPKHEINKTYQVSVTGYSQDALCRLKRPVTLDGYTIRQPQVSVASVGMQNDAVLLVTIHEGRNRQVRRMCDLAGMKVTRLVRIAEGPVNLSDMKIGSWRHLTETELQELKNYFANL